LVLFCAEHLFHGGKDMIFHSSAGVSLEGPYAERLIKGRGWVACESIRTLLRTFREAHNVKEVKTGHDEATLNAAIEKYQDPRQASRQDRASIRKLSESKGAEHLRQIIEDTGRYQGNFPMNVVEFSKFHREVVAAVIWKSLHSSQSN
jgi:hypothetical protein